MKTPIKFLQCLLTVIFFASVSITGYAQTITTDAADYAPGSTATFTGSGWLANEAVTVTIQNLTTPICYNGLCCPHYVTADANGDFTLTWTVCQCNGDSLLATATGQTSNIVATVNFTDSQTGTACISTVVAEDGGCVVSSMSSGNQFWDVQENHIYAVTLTGATDVANGGTDATIEVIVKNTNTGNQCYTATNPTILFPPFQAGVYVFDVVMPENACFTYPMLYGTSNCMSNTGLFAQDANCSPGGHLRAATFDSNCNKIANDESCQTTCETAAISSCTGGGSLGCNPTSTNPALETPTYTGTEPVTVSHDDQTSNTDCHYTITRTWTVSNACGSATCTQTYTYTLDNIAPTITCPPNITQCDDGGLNTLDIGTATATDNCTGAISFASTTSQVSNFMVGVTVVTWTATDGCGNTATCSQTVTINPLPNVSISPAGPISACESQDCVTLTASGADSYLWSPTGETTPSVDVCNAGTFSYSVVGTINATGCTASAGPVSVTIHPNPTCGIDPLQYDANNNNSWDENELPTAGSTNNIITATYIAEAGSTLHWTTSNPGQWPITGGQGSAILHFTAGPIGTSATFTLLVTSPYNCTSTCDITFTTEVHEQCAYTQGFYGSTNGQMTCIGLTAVPAIKQALGCAYPCPTTGTTPFATCNPIVIGQGSRKVTINCTAAAATCLNSKMPSSGNPEALPNASVDICNATGNTWLNNQNRLKNTLLGQAITLNLNMRLFPGLANLHITTASFTTYGRVPGDCDPNSTSFVASNVVTKTIPQSVINCLGTNSLNNTVTKLRDLANRALGYTGNGNPTCAALSCTGTCTPPTFADITAALTAINEGFDACRFMSGFNVRMDNVSEALLNGESTMVVYPNPATDMTSVEFLASNTGNATVSVYNINGALINILFNEGVTEGSAYKVNFNTNSITPGIYFVRLVVGNEISVSKLVVMERE